MSRIVEIEGIKVEVDERTARTIESYKVGDPVKLLKKTYSGYDVHTGVIVGFCDFKELPTIEVMYLSRTGTSMEFAVLNAKTEDVQLAPVSEAELVLDKQSIVEKFEREITKAVAEVEDLQRKQKYFMLKFGAAFKGIDEVLDGIEEATVNG